MKNIIKYGLLSLVAAAGVSCESFLNEKVVSGVSYDYLETKTGIETAVNGVYSTMRWYVGGERYYCLTEYGVDYVWEGMYLPKVGDMTDAEKTAREGELRFMRAYFYFDLVQQFGRIPLLTEGNVSEIKTDFKRASVADVYAFIISDLRQAYEVLPDVAMQADRGRATKWSAANLLSKVYWIRIIQ